ETSKRCAIIEAHFVECNASFHKVGGTDGGPFAPHMGGKLLETLRLNREVDDQDKVANCKKR
ncbi:MAG: hypothetical protein AAGL99_18480, partial [Pseudomonadota bacterium]